MGDVAGRDVIKITITTTTSAAAHADDVDAVLKVIGTIRDDLGKLPGVSKYDRGDADDDLRKAQDARDDKPRMLEKLESAQNTMLKIGSATEGVIKLAEMVGVLIQRLLGM